jgi:hypothetical protein
MSSPSPHAASRRLTAHACDCPRVRHTGICIRTGTRCEGGVALLAVAASGADALFRLHVKQWRCALASHRGPRVFCTPLSTHCPVPLFCREALCRRGHPDPNAACVWACTCRNSCRCLSNALGGAAAVPGCGVRRPVATSVLTAGWAMSRRRQCRRAAAARAPCRALPRRRLRRDYRNRGRSAGRVHRWQRVWRCSDA